MFISAMSRAFDYMQVPLAIVATDLTGIDIPDEGCYFRVARLLGVNGPMTLQAIRDEIGENPRIERKLNWRSTDDEPLLSLRWVEEWRERANASRSRLSAAGHASAEKRAKGKRKPNKRSTEDTHALNSSSTNVEHTTILSSTILSQEERKVEPAREFEPAWEAYGRHGNKLPAHKAWAKLTNPDRDACLAAIPAYVKGTNTNGVYPSRKNFSTYLNERAWEDAVPSNGAARNGDARSGTWHKDREGRWVAPSGRTEDELHQVERTLIKERKQLSAEDLKAVDEEAWHWSYKLNGT